MTTDFSTYSGSEFLLWYTAMLAGAVFAAWLIPARLRPEGREGILDSELCGDGAVSKAALLGYLAGGPNRAALAGYADTLSRSAAQGTDILAHFPGEDMKLASLRQHATGSIVAARERLVDAGLMMTAGAARALRWYAVAPFLVVAAVGLYRRQAGVALGEPVGLLSMLLLLTAVLAIVRFAVFDRLTRSGQDVLARTRAAADRLRRAPTSEEMGTAVALFGTGILVGTPFEPLHAAQRGSDAGGSGCGADGGSGCGGGGCGGGCGGCGG